MDVDEVLAALRKLDRTDKLRAMQVLASELASEEGASLAVGGQYELWSPHDSAAAARALTELLEADRAGRADAGA